MNWNDVVDVAGKILFFVFILGSMTLCVFVMIKSGSSRKEEPKPRKKFKSYVKFGGSMPPGAEFPIGSLVIVRSNEDDPLDTGIVIGHYIQDNAPPIPMLQYEKGGEIFMGMAITIPYSQVMWDRLVEIGDPKKQYDYLSGLVMGTEFRSLQESFDIAMEHRGED